MVELPRLYELEGQWVCGLKEIQVSLRDGVAYVCSDICCESYAENTMLTVLRALQKPEGKRALTYFLFDNPIHMKIKPTVLNRIRVFI